MSEQTTSIPKARRPKWGDPDSRCVRHTSAMVYSRGARNVIVNVYPNGTIGLRLKGERREEFIDAADAYRNAVLARKAAERAAKKRKSK